jgi:hypothetical protein
MLQVDPTQRLDVQAVLNHPWLAGLSDVGGLASGVANGTGGSHVGGAEN